LPIWVEPSKNVTVPFGAGAPGAGADTVAVKVTAWPTVDGFSDELSAIEAMNATIVMVTSVEA
jgi:hypothetical protein